VLGKSTERYGTVFSLKVRAMNEASADRTTPHEDRTYAVTGAAAGIGAATAQYLRERGARVIACDLHNADIVGDLATGDGRAALVEGVTHLSGGRIDAIVANAGGGPPETMLSLNFFGAVATLEGLRPLLEASPAPRAVMVSSIGSLAPNDPGLVEACLSEDECAATAAARDALAAGRAPSDLRSLILCSKEREIRAMMGERRVMQEALFYGFSLGHRCLVRVRPTIGI
jgi:NAD(P)-dependent dehydrogenase (short-subunit alcohol dehydrogenase family)